jgi:uncharacterized protein YidB (DUF937 family)
MSSSISSRRTDLRTSSIPGSAKTVNDLSRQADTPQDDLLSQLSRYLPGVIDKLTPNGQLPNPADLRSDYRRN